MKLDHMKNKQPKTAVHSKSYVTVRRNSTKPKPGSLARWLATLPGDLGNRIALAIQTGAVREQGLTATDLARVGPAGNTVAHLLAVGLHLHEVPRELLTPEILAARNAEGQTPQEIAKTLLEKAPRGGRQHQLFRAAKNGTLNQFELAPEDRRHRCGRGDTIFHVAARWGNIDQIPKRLLTEEILSSKNAAGETPDSLAEKAKDPRWIRKNHLFDLAYEGRLATEGLTEADMQLEHSTNGNTLAQVAAHVGKLKQIPEHLLTYEVVAKRDRHGWSVYDTAKKNGCTNAIPRPVAERFAPDYIVAELLGAVCAEPQDRTS
jgi:hypothetical protein